MGGLTISERIRLAINTMRLQIEKDIDVFDDNPWKQFQVQAEWVQIGGNIKSEVDEAFGFRII